MEEPKWSQMSQDELLDLAQQELHDRGPDVASVVLAAAQVQATHAVELTLEHVANWAVNH